MSRSQRVLPGLAGPDPHHLLQIEHEDLAVADLVGPGGGADRGDDLIGQRVGDDDSASLGELLDSNALTPEEEVGRDDVADQLDKALAELPAEERQVIELRFGRKGEQPHTVAQTGRKLGVSTAEAQRLEERALNRLARQNRVAALREAA